MIKRLIVFIGIVSVLFANNIHMSIKDIANISAIPLYNYDGKSLESIINQYIIQHKNIKAVIVFDTTNNTIFYSVFKKNNKLIKNTQLPKEYKKLNVIKSDIIYNSTLIGKVIVYTTTNNKEIFFTKAEMDWIKKHPVITFASMSKYPPLAFVNKHKQYTGILSEYIKILEQKTGIKFKRIDTHTIEDSIQQVKENKIDMLIATNKKYTPQKLFNFSIPYLNYSIVMVTTLDKSFLDNIKTLYGHKVVVLKGFEIDKFLQQYPQIQLVYANSIKEALNMVDSKKVFSFVELLPVASYNINKYNFFNLKIAGKTTNTFPLSIALNKKLGKTGITVFNKVLEHITDQKKEMIYNKWVGITFNKRVDYTIIWQISIISFIILSIVLYWNRKLKIQQLALKKMTIKAQIATKAKSEFISNMSHEIRTPMNAIIGFTEILSKEIKDPIQLTHLKTIQNASNALLMLINDILDLSKIEAGKLHIQKRPSNILTIIEEIKTIFSIEAEKKGLDIIIDIPKNIPNSLVIDTVRVRQILLNLVGNAIKFTQKGYIKITLSIQKIKNEKNKVNLIFSVEDTGKGIPKDQISVIFEAFEQVKGQDIKQFGGTGLGLSISSKLAKMMDGKLSVESTEGKGSTFTLTLYNVEIASSNHHSTTIINKEIIFSKATILAVDDIEDNNTLIINYFKDTNVNIITANNGQEAIEKFKNNKIDLILMNIKMPIMNGNEAAKKIKEISDVPIIALTASITNNNYKYFDDCLKKPFTKQQLFSMISKYLEYKTQTKKPPKEEMIEFALNKNAKANIKALKKELELEIIPIYNKIKKTNNISDIKIFIKKLDKLSQKYKILSLQNYTQELTIAIKTFDISKIEMLLSHFIKFINIVNDNLK